MTGIAALAVYAGLLALLAGAVFVRPPTALAAVSCIYGLKQWGQSTSGFLADHPPVTNLAIGVLVLCAIVSAKLRGRCILCGIPKITWLIFALLLYSLLSLAWTPRPDIAGPIWVVSGPYLLTFVVLVPLVLHETEDFRVALSWLIVVGGLLVLVLLIFGHWGLRGLELGTHSAEQETNPLALAGLGGSVAAAAMLLQPKKGSVVAWVFRLGVVGASLILIVRSESRGQLVAVVAAMLLMFPFSVKISSLQGMIATAVGCIVVAIALQYAFTKVVDRESADRWSQTTSSADAEIRLSMVEKLLNASSASGTTMLFGLGSSASWDPDINGIYPHNVPMEVLGEEGVLGFILYASIFVAALVTLLQAIIASSGDQASRCVVTALGAGFLFFILLTFKQGNMIGSVEFFMYAILIARLARALTQTRSADTRPRDAVAVCAPLYPNMMR